MQKRVIINGALGKMGSLACETIDNHPDFLLAAKLVRGDNLEAAIIDTKAQIVIDLTRADCAYKNALIIINQNVHPVIGTSGLLTDEIKHLEKLALDKKLGGIIAPNFSISAVLMMQFSAQAARYLTEVEIIETHHQQKYDAPSGTAIKTAEMIAAARIGIPDNTSHQELIKGSRGGTHQGIKIHSLRLPGVVARQQVIFGNTGETLSIMHDSIDRVSFMPGVILCCQKVMSLDRLYYGLETIL